MKSREKAEEYIKEYSLIMKIDAPKVKEFNYSYSGCKVNLLSVRIDNLTSFAFGFSDGLGNDNLTIDEAVGFYLNQKS